MTLWGEVEHRAWLAESHQRHDSVKRDLEPGSIEQQRARLDGAGQIAVPAILSERKRWYGARIDNLKLTDADGGFDRTKWPTGEKRDRLGERWMMPWEEFGGWYLLGGTQLHCSELLDRPATHGIL